MQRPLWLLILIGSGSAVVGASLGFALWTLFTPKSPSLAVDNPAPTPIISNTDNSNTNQNTSNKSVITQGLEALTGQSTNANRARQSEAKTYVGSMNRAQQAFYLEKQQFAPNMPTLAVGIPSETQNYSYSINPIDRIRTQNTGIPRGDELKAYTGGVFVTQYQGRGDYTTLAVLCESNQPTRNLPPPIVTIDGQSPQCPSGYTAIN